MIQEIKELSLEINDNIRNIENLDRVGLIRLCMDAKILRNKLRDLEFAEREK